MEASWAGKTCLRPMPSCRGCVSHRNNTLEATMRTKLNHSLLLAGRILSKVGIALACILALFPANVSFAQAVSSAKMHGTVTDNTGAVVSGASVVATQTAS